MDTLVRRKKKGWEVRKICPFLGGYPTKNEKKKILRCQEGEKKKKGDVSPFSINLIDFLIVGIFRVE